jgi:hypothetical protein
MRPCVCFEAGRFNLTQSSWTAPLGCSRKWMSGHAAALALPSDPRQFGKSIRRPSALRDFTHKVQGDLRLSIDFYLSWMSPLQTAFSLGALRSHFVILSASTPAGIS